MRFLWPDMLWLLLLAPALIAAYVLMLRRRRTAAVRYASLALVRGSIGAGQRIRRHVPPALVLLGLVAAIVAASWGFGHLLSGRATFIQVGAMVATIMTANVFLVIIPNQKLVVEDLKAGRTPDPEYGEIAKLRSTHNNYLTLPVIFMMISNHYPMTFGHQWNWVIVALVLALVKAVAVEAFA